MPYLCRMAFRDDLHGTALTARQQEDLPQKRVLIIDRYPAARDALRTMLSTRDGHTIGVTLLSSDMGKLYVALAQAIERLRD